MAGAAITAAEVAAPATDFRHCRTLPGHSTPVKTLAASGDVVVSGGTNGRINVWRISDGTLLKSLCDRKGSVESVVMSLDGTTLVSAGKPGTLHTWSVADGKQLAMSDGKEHAMWPGFSVATQEVVWSPDGEFIASSSIGSGWIMLWRPSDLTLVDKHDPLVEPTSVTFTRKREFVVGGHDGRIIIFRISGGKCIRILKGHSKPVFTLVVTPDGETLISGSVDSTIRVWRLSDGALLRTLEGHSSVVNSVVVLGASGLIASGSGDKTVKIWRISDGSLVQTLTGHSSPVYAVAADPTGKILFSAGRDGAIMVWSDPFTFDAMKEVVQELRDHGARDDDREAEREAAREAERSAGH